MEIQVRTDRRLLHVEELDAFIGFEVVDGLGPCARRVLSAHVHLTVDHFAPRGQPELSCVLEVLPHDHVPLAVTHRAATNAEAVRGAVGDMRDVLERMFRRIDARGPDAAVNRHKA